MEHGLELLTFEIWGRHFSAEVPASLVQVITGKGHASQSPFQGGSHPAVLPGDLKDLRNPLRQEIENWVSIPLFTDQTTPNSLHLDKIEPLPDVRWGRGGRTAIVHPYDLPILPCQCCCR